MIHSSIYDCIIVGGGHAGIEAALAVARSGFTVLLATMNKDMICQMSCNPAIGGIAKGQMVREIDALGGEMGKAIDSAGIQFRMLNRAKGPAVWSPRAQADKKQYRLYMQRVVENTPLLDTVQAEVAEIIIEDGSAKGIRDSSGKAYWGRHVVITTGTFLKGLMHVGDKNSEGGRRGEKAALYLSASLLKNGIRLERFKTGTPPRLDTASIDYSVLEEHSGDEVPIPFSYQTEKITQSQILCYMTYTNGNTHQLIKDNLHLSSLYSGRIQGLGPRYCPSIEDKVVKFADKERHQIYLEPEGLDTNEVYVNGFSMSFPEPVQIQVVRTMKGLEKAEFTRPAYAIEYDYSPPTQIHMSLETKAVKNLFLAGQINGTSGYEEAAAQGLLAGLNVIRKLRNEAIFALDRSEAYAGVMIDDLTTRGTNEPYRMFTSRAEFRLLLRQDNADERLMHYGHAFGLISDDFYEKTKKRYERIHGEVKKLKGTFHQNKSLDIYIKRLDGAYKDIPEIHRNGDLSALEIDQVELHLKYEGYIKRQNSEIKKFKRMEGYKLPVNLDYSNMAGMTREAKDKLAKFQPASIGQASRIPGITACDLSVLLVHLQKVSRQK